ncbi:photosynthetic complex putative assembly protein PuhB [Roseivivax isoporae]|uniref:Photosynthetic complex assembly protein n=1 Tax=Roseivivax isoporae LMG 25204 TaxID=1449351 RepID=X7FC46_9RHOB|nr:photosynthetic complex putative assembly protein PuhB [Roseivivax isoporae]ETX29666.1 photosynthetic complex assembly protein [Roseivivax isoporae LMG 25204]
MSHDDFATEPVPGLPELPPEGERILWQGRPQAAALAWHSLSLPWVAGYFVALALWRFLSLVDMLPIGQVVGYSVPFLFLGGIVLALLFLVAYVQARSTVYTVTNRRVAMRVGAALTLTLNLPYTQIARADLARGRFGTGTIVFETLGETRFSYMVLWPHLRPWRFARTQPALRCIPDADRVARLIADAAEARLSVPQVRRVTPAPAVADPAGLAAE